MMKDKAKGKKKDKKISKKKKIAESKKIEEKKVAIESKKSEESELEEEIEAAEGNMGIPSFFQPLPPSGFSPILEKVAKVRETNLERQISNTEIKKGSGERREIIYDGEKSNYEMEKPREGNNFNYEAPTKYDFAPDEKKKDAVNFNVPKQKWGTDERKTMASMERAGFDEIKNENRGKKYLTNRGYD